MDSYQKNDFVAARDNFLQALMLDPVRQERKTVSRPVAEKTGKKTGRTAEKSEGLQEKRVPREVRPRIFFIT